ncbi:hypothetical protein K461DRAFT_286845 [Myriangium duriaei CBS 260.36]|uniref:SAC3/GANP/THP3 conserved domain-containing protein n=1 Tax=Myriangium duriaei CBS 260.36 TaxID=1168546 RepID=A0A9P4MF85_9PEZI|nr:hypothetical protein K461DRAFT_286845 [Myriangium duriaei CBS 260.36]
MASSWPHIGLTPTANYRTSCDKTAFSTPRSSADCVIAAQAYTAVNARTSLANPLVTSHPPSQPPSTSNPAPWSEAIKEYVSRAFMTTNTIPGIDRKQITAKLKEVIEAARHSGMVDWSTMPLPQQLIQLERQALPDRTAATLVADSPSPDSNSKKRKSSELLTPTSISASSTPPWIKKTGEQQNNHSGKKQKKVQESRSSAGKSKFNDLEKRRQRFELPSMRSPVNSPSGAGTPAPGTEGPVVGTCQKLEKSYFRLTSAPKPDSVRPLEILKQSLELIIRKWKDEHNYVYICDQFKSMRQDLTVQHIKNEFTVRVYEAHARIALEKGDLGEYNQCQSQLRPLYKQNLGGRPGEFTAYRILYLIHTCNRTGMNDMLADLTVADKKHPAVKHALEVRSALATGNYHKFFKLFEDPPNMGGYLMDMFVQRERIAAMASISKAYKPDVKVSFLTDELAFGNDQECAQFLCDFAGEEYLESRTDGPRFSTARAIDAFQKARQAAFSMVDIKGQI